MYVSVSTRGNQKKIWDPLELELHRVVSCPTWELGTKFKLSKKQHVLLAPEPCLKALRSFKSCCPAIYDFVLFYLVLLLICSFSIAGLDTVFNLLCLKIIGFLAPMHRILSSPPFFWLFLSPSWHRFSYTPGWPGVCSAAQVRLELKLPLVLNHYLFNYCSVGTVLIIHFCGWRGLRE